MQLKHVLAILPLFFLSQSLLAAEKFMAMSECIKLVKSNGKEFKLRIGISTFDLSKSECDQVGKSKSVGMAGAGWFCSGDEKRKMESTHVCEKIDKSLEDLGLSNVRKRKAILNTYLIFTDNDKHLSQISFWDKPIAPQLCGEFKSELQKANIKDAECIAGK